eukprot:Lankesteria_metandrocarpae@DN5505_c0_g1_i1.p1
MDEMRALLDSLMGADRDSSLEDRKNKQNLSWKSPEVCKHYLLDFCPHELFPNTRRDLGACHGIHSDGLKEQFQADPERLKFLPEYEKQFARFLQDLVDQVEQKIRKSTARIEATAVSESDLVSGDTLTPSQKKRIATLNEEIAKLLTDAQTAGEEGDVKRAELLTCRLTPLRKEVERVRTE